MSDKWNFVNENRPVIHLEMTGLVEPKFSFFNQLSYRLARIAEAQKVCIKEGLSLDQQFESLIVLSPRQARRQASH